MKRGRGRPKKNSSESKIGSASQGASAPASQGDLSDNEILDPKPLRTLSPMFPSSLGFQTITEQTLSPPLIKVTPFSPFDSGSNVPNFTFFPQTMNTTPNQPNGSRTRPVSNGPINATPISSFKTPVQRQQEDDDEEEEEMFSTHTSTSGRKIKRPSHFTGYASTTQEATPRPATEKPKKVKKPYQNITANDLSVIAPTGDPREDVEVVLMTFDALRRRLLQLDELLEVSSSKRADLKAGAIMMGGNLRANMGKRLGVVPGVQVGDIFYFRMEMCIIGLHAPSMGGIDYMTKYGDEDEPVAICVVSAGGYDNDENDPDVLVYTGQGANSDQKLERGNLALERSLYRKNEIRVVRAGKDPSVQGGKIYVYDGLYRIQNSWKEKGKNDFSAFKYKLLREKNQPPGMQVWKMTQKWIENPSSRGGVILQDLSSGVENLPVVLVNEVDNSKGPGFFNYVSEVKYIRNVEYMKPLTGCKCPSVCLPGDPNCNCSHLNGSELPYSSMGLLVSRKVVVFECTPNCQCTINCRNRVTQKGTKLHFEVFKTNNNKGWGLRSWDPIRAGTFICEYTGEVIDELKVNLNDEKDDEYLFQTNCPGEKTLKWNFGTELIGENPKSLPNDNFKNLPIKISAKNMGNVSRFMNHSCNPNVFWQPVLYDHGDEGHPHIMFFAMRHIPPLTELTFDYGTSGKNKRCFCGSANCRGFF